ncbi:MAG TPA: alpha-amylase family glycosyl hydrolase [Cellvibrio sp.]|nr:alpha-amylase family glycosyl hydrolase [Cellvibrio sp.]
MVPKKGYHLRGTQTDPNFIVNDMMEAVAGSANTFEICRKFDAEPEGQPRFKIDLDGTWAKSWPTEDKVVKVGWVKISFNNQTNVITVKENQLENCAAPKKGYHLRGTQTDPNFIVNDMMEAVAGSANNFEICRKFDAETAPAQPRFKIDLDGTWTKSWPAEDKVVKVGWVKIAFNNQTNAITVKENQAENCGGVSSSSNNSSSASSVSSVAIKSSEPSVSSKSSTSTSSAVSSSAEAVAHDFRGRTAYFVMLDRFVDGDLTNNTGVSTSKATGNLAEWKKYWGGDIDGLIAKLPYLKSLGVSAVVVSSLVDNTATGYQGYWARDFYAVDEHLASDISKVKKLDEEMEKLGMKLVMEITLNNTSSETGEVGKLWKDKAPVISDFANGVNDGWYHNNGSIGVDGCATQVLCDAAWNDPLVYLTKSVGGRPDFIQGKTSNSIADEYLIGAAKFWLENGVDGFRIHSTKFIEPAFVNRFSAAVREEKADAYIFGDWPDSDTADLTSAATFVKARRGSELMDNALRNNIEAAIVGDKTMNALSAHIQSRSASLAGKENLQAIYLDNNNDSRTSVVLRAATTKTTSRGPGKGMGKASADARQNMGVALVMTLPGVPVIYYGTEQNTAVFDESSGIVGGEPYNRELITFDTAGSSFKLIKALADLRKNSLAVQQGGYEERWVSNDVLVYQRETADGKDCAVVAINRGAKITVPVKKLCLAPATYTNLLAADKVVVANGEAEITLDVNQVLVLH